MNLGEDRISFSIDDLLKIQKLSNSSIHPTELLSSEAGLKSVAGSWTVYYIIDKQKLMLFLLKYPL
jgi:hypothetical protein